MLSNRSRGWLGFAFILGAIIFAGGLEGDASSPIPSPFGFLIFFGIGAYLILTSIPYDD